MMTVYLSEPRDEKYSVSIIFPIIILFFGFTVMILSGILSPSKTVKTLMDFSAFKSEFLPILFGIMTAYISILGLFFSLKTKNKIKQEKKSLEKKLEDMKSIGP